MTRPANCVAAIGKLVMAVILAGLPTAVLAQVSNPYSEDKAMFRRCLSELKCADVRNAAYQNARAGEFPLLVRRYRVATRSDRDLIVQAIYWAGTGRGDRQVIEIMRRRAFGTKMLKDRSETRWYALQFLAEACDPDALAALSAGGGVAKDPFQYKVACNDWAQSLNSFGSCKYDRATQVLVSSLNSSCLDVEEAAASSLLKLHPDVCLNRSSFEDLEECYLGTPKSFQPTLNK